MDSLFIVLALIAGALLAVQAGANAQLARAIGSPFAATTLQLSIGSVLSIALALATGTLAALAALPHVEWWHAAGGLASAVYVVSAILLFPRLGAVVCVGLMIAGQMTASVAIDAFGWLGLASAGLQRADLLGALVVLTGAALIVLGQADGAAGFTRDRIGWIALALFAGAVLPVQGAVNSLLRHDLGGATFAVGTVSFVVATLGMACVLLVTLGWRGTPRPHLDGVSAMPWWGWLGGFAGATYVTTVFTTIPAIGAATAIGLTVVGQQIASVFVDVYGWFRLPKRPVSGLRLVGVALLVAGVATLQAG